METIARIWMRICKVIGWIIKGIRRTIRRMSPEQKRLCVMGIIALALGCFLGSTVGQAVEKKNSEKKVAEAVAEVEKKDKEALDAVQKQLYDLKDKYSDHQVELPWNMVLVNYEHPMKQGYIPELKELEPGYSVDIRIADAANEMLADAKKAGLHVIICSAYRSVERQKNVFDESMKDCIEKGMGYWEAYCDTVKSVAEPGESEHALGLALDLISNQYTELDKGQENTKEAKWLAENCYKYGFILRYPPEKTNITGIIYEPWHYRYVGKEDAKKIHDLGITLEEYLQDHYKGEGGQ
jgi:D-alanyl-D-alanine carboxypeptidase